MATFKAILIEKAETGQKVGLVDFDESQLMEGDVTVRVMRKNGGYSFVDSADYSGGKVWFRTTDLPIKGVYVVKARYDKKAGSRWKNSRNEVEFRVVRP